MTIYSKQITYCMACGKEMRTDFTLWKGQVCDKECFEEIEWRKILSMLGKEYYPRTKSEKK